MGSKRSRWSERVISGEKGFAQGGLSSVRGPLRDGGDRGGIRPPGIHIRERGGGRKEAQRGKEGGSG